MENPKLPHLPRSLPDSPTPHSKWKLFTWKRKLFISHALDTAFLLVLQLGLDLIVQLGARVVRVAPGLVDWVQLVTKWTCLSTLMLLSIEFLVLFVFSSVAEIREGLQ